MDTLPDVFLRDLVLYLTPQELAAWSAVSKNWRERLNDDLFWRPFCNTIYAEYLKNTPCQVEPFFESPEDEESELIPLCEWRLCFMREVHLWNNWRLGRCLERFLPARSAFSQQYKIVQCALFYKNDYLITYNENTIEIWNVNQAPVAVCMEALLSTRDVGLFELCGDKIVVKQHFLIQVFQISIETGKIIFLHSFIYHGTEKNTEKIYDDDARLGDPLRDHPIDQFALIDHIVVCKDRGLPQILYVWNVETGEKVREEEKRGLKFANFYRHPSSKEPYCIVTAIDSNHIYVIMIYRLDDFVPVFTSPQFRRLPTETMVFQDYVFIQSYETLDIYLFKTGQHIRQLDTTDVILPDLQTVGPIVTFKGGRRTLMKFTPKNQVIEPLPEITFFSEEEMTIGPKMFLNERYCLLTLDGQARPYLIELKNDQVNVVRQVKFQMFVPGDSVSEEGVFNCINQNLTKLVVNSYRQTDYDRATHRFHLRANILHRMQLITFW